MNFRYVSGILLDSYFSATSEISGKIEDNDYKISQTVQVSDKTYGILVKDANLTKCFKMTLVGLHYGGTLSTIISNEIQSEVSLGKCRGGGGFRSQHIFVSVM